MGSQAVIDTLKTPIGLSIGAKGPAGVTVSVVAQLIQVSRVDVRLLRVEVDKATGLQLAHSQLGARVALPKPQQFSKITFSLVDAGVATVDVVVPDPNEIAEDLVSERLIHSLTWAGCVF